MLLYFLTADGSHNDLLSKYSNGTPLAKKQFVEEVNGLVVATRLPNTGQYGGHLFCIGSATTAVAAGTLEWFVLAMYGRAAQFCTI